VTDPVLAKPGKSHAVPKKIAIIGGDGIGPEVTREARAVLELYCARGLPIELWELDLGADRYLRDGTTLPPELAATLARECEAILLGALGDPRVPGFEHARDILFGFRFGFDLYANVRPVRALADRLVPLRGRASADVDFVVFRENTEGAYAGIGGQLRRGGPDEIAIIEDVNTRKGVERIVRAAFHYAATHGKRRVHLADKSNALRHAHELWYRTFHEIAAEYPSIENRHLYIDALCYELVRDPSAFEVVVTNNLFGDIVTDLGAALQGGLGMAPSANVNLGPAGNAKQGVALFEPVHGSAPPLAGRNVANPFGAILTVGMLMSHIGYPEEESRIEAAIRRLLQRGECTADVGGNLGTDRAGAAARDEIQRMFDEVHENERRG
jgi:3-isopropylmalate dehydrogenase